MSPRKSAPPLALPRLHHGGSRSNTSRAISLAVIFTSFLGLLFLFRRETFPSYSPPSSYRSSTSTRLPTHISLREYTPLTTVIGNPIPGYTVISNLYLHEGGYLAITDSPESLPEKSEIIRAVNDDVKTRWKVIGEKDADELGDIVGVLEGVTVGARVMLVQVGDEAELISGNNAFP